jgi:type II secretory pathway predicted ATPase ExeA
MLSAYFGFQKDPFSSTADSAFFIAHSSIKEAVGSLLFSQLSQRKGLTLITGEGGVGKTALLSSILEQDRAEGSSIYLSCGEDWSFGTLLERWSDELGIRDQVSVQEARIHAVIDFLSARSQQGNPVSTLLLDQAENLTDDALEGLTEFSKIESGGSALVQAILAARPEIGARLDHPKLQKVANGIVFRARLEPIKESEVGDYVRHRLRIAGFEGPALFSDDAIETVADASRGVAAHVNLLCHTALQLAELEQEKSVTAATAEQAIEVCTKYLSDRTDDTGGTAGDRPGHGTEQDALVGNSSLVGLALKERARTDDEIWPMQLDAGQPDKGQAEARQPSTRQPSTRQLGAGQPDFGRLDTGPLETGPVVLDEAWSSAVAETETSQGRRRSAGLWPVVGFVAVALTTGAGIAWYRLPTDSIARERPDVSEQLAFRQDETDADTSETQAEPPAGEQVVLAQGAADRVSSEAETEPPAGEQPASQQDETNAVIEEPKVEPPASPAPQTVQVLKAPRLAVTRSEEHTSELQSH